ncbi:uncharacterized protein PFL1_05752 [Pseudozyma flocculosa PF-1]|uniref:Glycoside hydrolase family 5 domain-containing protein n=2 Tax=Pseudozyma flocculosa TaxID=84751 RepID=A0A5C3FBN0_9BASI|nr:uncharacterized protein PFL1_05752 [Pseudozyma flocculosa PF-1]EPQ26773.1 hypothetical protein PFL1_05752 [Pseudozyma flocculosa PF-1]SPO40901.1 uncharacterized protein PSFLO_06383 [Pseudozyma flocculosa]
MAHGPGIKPRRAVALLMGVLVVLTLALLSPHTASARPTKDGDDGLTSQMAQEVQARGGTTIQDLSKMKHARWGHGPKPVRGVNIGGWLILENWQTPSLFLTPDLKDKSIPDEWTWSKTLGNTTATRKRLQTHYANWLNATDFKRMAEYGLNTVRLPVPYWAFVPNAKEPYLTGLQQPFIAKALGWARDNNLDVVLDLHGVPGSQNGYDNSGRAGRIGFGDSKDNMDLAILALMRMTELYVNDPSYRGVVKAIEVVNEPKVGGGAVPLDFLQEFYRKSYAAIRNQIDPKRAPLVPTILFSDAFLDLSTWDDFFWDKSWYKTGSYAIDTHSYQAWSPLKELSPSGHIKHACSLGAPLSHTRSIHPVVVGEFALGIETRCVPYQSCAGRSIKDDVATLNTDSQNLFARRFWEAQTQTFEGSGSGWIFWSWKGESTAAWSYQAAVEQGWIPRNLDERAFRTQAGPYCVEKSPSAAVSFKTRSG